MIEITHKVKGGTHEIKADGENELLALQMFYKYFNEEKEEKPHYKTGIKVDEDREKRYKCRYWCECGNERNHYITLDAKDVNCHKCGSLIDVEPATKFSENGIPKRDKWGNFFVADGRT